MPDWFRSLHLPETRTTTSVSGLDSPVCKEGSVGRGSKNPEGGSQDDETILNISLPLCVLYCGFQFVFAWSFGLLLHQKFVDVLRRQRCRDSIRGVCDFLWCFTERMFCNHSCFPSDWNTIAAALRVWRCSDLIELPENFSCMTDEWFFLQAGKLIANLIVLGSGVLLRAVSQAYRQAIVSECLSLSLPLCPSLSPLCFSLYFLPNSIQRFLRPMKSYWS
jgi:hypothetical protein